MKIKIIDSLKKFGILNEFIIGEGAKSKLSEIHYNLNSKKNNLEGINFALQFEMESQMIAIWDLRERLIIPNASFDLYVKSNFTWNSVSKIYTCDVGIGRRNSNCTSKIAIMPFSEFEAFLQFNNEFGFGIIVDNSDFVNDEYESVNIDGNIQEGKTIYFYGKKYERDSTIRNEVIKIQGHKCKICNFDFEKFYGDIGNGYIEVHHIIPLCKGEQNPNPTTDLIVICSNCHKMIHRNKKRTLSPEELKEHIKNTAKIYQK
jgi:hypothetical protein